MNLLLAHASSSHASSESAAEKDPEHDALATETEIVVQGERAKHLHRVLRAELGQRIRVGVARSSIGSAEVLECSEARVLLGNLELKPLGAAPRVRLIIALPRPKALRRLLQTAASFGVDHIDLVNAWRVEKGYWSSPMIEVPAMEEELWTGCEQGRHACVPTIAPHRFLMPFLSELPEEAQERRLLAHPGGERWLRADDTEAPRSLVAIGPEGGWIDDEVTSFVKAGFERFALSASILRSEIAVAAALAQFELLRTRE